MRQRKFNLRNKLLELTELEINIITNLQNLWSKEVPEQIHFGASCGQTCNERHQCNNAN